jgi:hypothetical protein
MMTFPMELVQGLVTIAVAVIGAAGGAGYWSYRTKKLEVSNKDDFKDELLKQVNKLMTQLQVLSETKDELLEQVYTLRTQLALAQTEIHQLHTIMKYRGGLNVTS